MDKFNPFGIRKVPSKPKPESKEEEKSREPMDAGIVVLGHISNLCNHVTQKSSLQALRNLQRDHKALFTVLISTFTRRTVNWPCVHALEVVNFLAKRQRIVHE